MKKSGCVSIYKYFIFITETGKEQNYAALQKFTARNAASTISDSPNDNKGTNLVNTGFSNSSITQLIP